ncbi:MAG: type II toxin-antitoxin system VapC family toxin [Acidobacteriota bacterium]
MSGFLVDTNVVSELTKPVPSVQIETFLRQAKDRVHTSVLSIGEIRKGIGTLATGRRRAVLEDWLELEIILWFGERILPITLDIAERWGALAARQNAKGRTRPVVDALLAATALQHDLTIVTRNVKDYDGLDIPIVNPWVAEP